jgi:hypothetical protein
MPRTEDDRERERLRDELVETRLRQYAQELLAEYGDDTAEALSALRVSMARAEERLRALERDAKIVRETLQQMREAVARIETTLSERAGPPPGPAGQAEGKRAGGLAGLWSWLLSSVGALLGLHKN